MVYTVIRQKIALHSSNVLCCDLSSSFIAAYDDLYCLQLLHPVSLALLQKLPTEFARKTHLSLISVSPDEQLILCATVLGDVVVIKTSSGDVMCRVCEHSGHSISSVVWQASTCEEDKSSTLVYVGDISGVVTLINVPTTKVSAIFKTVCTRLLKLDSSVTQLDFLNGQLLVSTLSASFICDTRREAFTKVGEKSQSGKFGGCLLKVWPSADESTSPPSPSMTQHCASSKSSCSSSTLTENFGCDDLRTLIQLEKEYDNILYSYHFHTQSLSVIHSRAEISYTNNERKHISYMGEKTNRVWAGRARPKLSPEVRCFSGRPKARIWESDVSGHVLRTHALSDALSVPPLVVYDAEMDGVIAQSSIENLKPASRNGIMPNGAVSMEAKARGVDKCTFETLSLNIPNSSVTFQSTLAISFSQILGFQNKFLLLVCTEGLYCYDSSSCAIIFHLKISIDGKVKACGNNLLVSSEGIFTKFAIMSPEVGILALHSMHLLKSCAHLALQHLNLFEHSSVLCRVRNLVIRDILSVLTDASDRQKLEKLLDRLTQKLEPRSLDELLPCQEKVTNITNLTAVSVSRSSHEQNLPSKSIESVNQVCADEAVDKELDVHLPLLRPRPVLGVGCSGLVHLSSYRPSGHTVFQDLVESVASNVPSSSLLSAFSSKVTAAAKRSFDSVTTNFNDVSPHLGNARTHSVDNFDGSPNGNDNSKDNDARLPIQERALEDVTNRDYNMWVNHSVNLSRPASDSQDGTPNSCEDSVGVLSETDDLIVFRSVRRKKKTRNALRKKMGLKNFSRSSPVASRESIVSTSSNEMPEDVLLGLVEKFSMKTSTCKKEIHSMYDPCTLTLWLSEFIQFLKALYSSSTNGRDSADDDPMSDLVQLGKLTSNHTSLQRNISFLLVLCLNNKLSVDCALPENGINANKTSVNYHFLTATRERDLDDFYARLFASAHDIIDKEFIINNSSAPALYSFLKTWRVLLSSMCEDCAAVIVVQPPPMIDILPALDFSRYQRLTVLTRSLFQDGVSGLCKAAAKLRHSATVFEMLVVFKCHSWPSWSCSHSSPQDSGDLVEVLYLYLSKVCICSETQAKYLQVWSCSRQMQYDIIHCILKKKKHLLHSCPCGAALPATLPLDAVVSLLRTVVTGPLYDPAEVYELCLTFHYWRGCALVFLLHELGEVSECMPTVLQSCSAEALAILLQAIQPSHVPQLLSLLSCMSDGVQPLDLKCYHCGAVSSVLGELAKPTVNSTTTTDPEISVPTVDATMSFSELPSAQRDSENDCLLPLPELWARCVEAAVGLVGGAAVLQLLQDLVCSTNILPGVIPTCVYRMLVVVCTIPLADSPLLRRSWLCDTRGAAALPLQEKRRILRRAREKWIRDSSVDSLPPAASAAGGSVDTGGLAGGAVDQGGRTRSSVDTGGLAGGAVDQGGRTRGSVDTDGLAGGAVDQGGRTRGSVDAGCRTSGSVDAGCRTSGSLDADVTTSTSSDGIAIVEDTTPKSDGYADLNGVAIGVAGKCRMSSCPPTEQKLPAAVNCELHREAHPSLPSVSSKLRSRLCVDSRNERYLQEVEARSFTASEALVPLSGANSACMKCRHKYWPSEPVYGVRLRAEGADCITCNLPLSLPSLLAPGQASSASQQNQLHALANLHSNIRSIARSRLVHRVHYSNIDSIFSAIVRALEYKPESIPWKVHGDHRARNSTPGCITVAGKDVWRSVNRYSAARKELEMVSVDRGSDCHASRHGQAMDALRKALLEENYSWLCRSNGRVTGLLVRWCSHAAHAACLHSQGVNFT